MLRTRNKYCSNCLETRRFLDLGTCLVCESCTKRLEVEAGAGAGNSAAGVSAGRVLVLPESALVRRQAC